MLGPSFATVTVSVVVPVCPEYVALIVDVPAARVDATPVLAPMVADVVVPLVQDADVVTVVVVPS